MDTRLHQLLQGELQPGEEIVASGQPNLSVHFTKSDGFLIPFSIFWCGFAIFWELSVLGIFNDPGNGGAAPLSFTLFGLPFVCIGLYFVFGRFIYKSYKKKHTYYVVTNKRVMVINDLRNKKITAAFIYQIPNINKTVRSDGVGTIIFGNASQIQLMYGNTGMDGFGSYYGVPVPVFYDVDEADKVYQTVVQIQHEAASNNQS